METTPTSPSPEKQTPELVARFKKLPRWAQILVTIVVVPVVLILAIAIGRAFYYQVQPLPANQDQAGNSRPACSEEDKAYCLPFDQAFAAATPSINPNTSECTNLAHDPTDNSSSTTLARIGEHVCDQFIAKGQSLIEQPLTAGHLSNYLYEGYNGVGVITSDNTYLVSFSVFLNNDKRYEMQLNSAILLNTKTVTSLKAISLDESVAKDAQLIEVSGTDASGKPSQEYFGEDRGRYSEGAFEEPVVKNDDGSFSSKVYNYTIYNSSAPAKVSFLVPYTFGPGEGIPDRDNLMERATGVRPLYHQGGCGLEDSYGDMAFYANGNTIQINFGYQPTLHITTAMTGYDPEQWGKVLFDIPYATFESNALNPKAYKSQSKVEVLTVAGYPVKHVGPITPDRTCTYRQNQTYDMYQTVRNGGVVTIIIPHYPTNGSYSEDERKQDDTYAQKLVPQVLKTLTFSPR